MKTFRFALFFSITLVLIATLDSKISKVPPLGKFLSPFHGFWQNAESEVFGFAETLELEGLKEPVRIYYDEIQVPHIYAENLDDLHFVQGYLTARDRLWQMDFFNRLVMGRLSEVIGERALNYDRLNRRIGLKKITETTYLEIQKNEELNRIFQSYAKGVNAYLENTPYRKYPIEFKLLNYDPEPWTPQKSCIAYAMLSNNLSRREADLENTNAFHLFGEEIFNLLYPDKPGNLDPVIPSGTVWDFNVTLPKKPDLKYPDIRVKTTVKKPHPLNGSNNFAVMSEKTKNGSVLLANEPDLELNQPSIWYAYHLHSPQKNVMGVTVPGTPLIAIGFNDSIAWGVTNSPRDQVDWYSVTFKDSTQNEYWYNEQWFKTEKMAETFHIANGKTFTDTIVYVHNGPVVYDRNFKGDSEKANFAMKWVAHLPSTTLEAMNELNKAQNYQEFVDALKLYGGPPQNFIFGSSSGSIGLWLPGKFPIKWEGQGKFLMSGTNPAFEYKEFIPFEHTLHVKDPEKGFLSSANQHPVDSLYPYYTYDHHYEYYRNRRINDRLRVMNNIVPKDMMKLQNDNFNYMASESLSFMLAQLDTTQFSELGWGYHKMLKQWDFFNDPDLKAPTVYQFWWNMIYQKLWDEFDTISIAARRPDKYTTIHLLKNNPDFPFSDILETDSIESTRALINISYTQAIDSLENWKAQNGNTFAWFEYKNTHINHVLGLKPFSKDKIRIGGYGGIVNAAGSGHGPSWRMVVELDPKGTRAWGIYPGSQTGNPGHPRYGQMIDRWASGDYFELLFGQDISSSEKIKFTQEIQPK